MAMNPGSVDFPETIPSLQLYFLLGIVYAVVTPILLPFILIFFALAYLVSRHQIINVYNQQYESAAAFWPHVHTRFVPLDKHDGQKPVMTLLQKSVKKNLIYKSWAFTGAWRKISFGWLTLKGHLKVLFDS